METEKWNLREKEAAEAYGSDHKLSVYERQQLVRFPD